MGAIYLATICDPENTLRKGQQAGRARARRLGDVRVAASGGKRRRAGFYSAIRREVPIRTFNDWKSPPPGFCEVDMVAHGGTSVAIVGQHYRLRRPAAVTKFLVAIKRNVRCIDQR